MTQIYSLNISRDQKSETRFSWLKSSCQWAYVPSGGSRGESVAYILLLEVACIPWLVVPFLHPQIQQYTIISKLSPLVSHLSTSLTLITPPSYKKPNDYIGPS